MYQQEKADHQRIEKVGGDPEWKKLPLKNIQASRHVGRLFLCHMPKILFTGVHRPHRSPSQRYRIEQFLVYLKSKGYTYDYTYIITEKDDQYFYKPGHYFSKAFFLFKSFVLRWWETLSFDSYDYIFVQREAMVTGACFYERKAAKSKAKLIFDFDDAIWLQHISEGNKKFSFLKDPQKTQKLIQMADVVLAGNTYLQNYALQYNSNSIYFPTIVDTDKYQKKRDLSVNDYVCIGWSGSFSTFEHLLLISPVLERLSKRYGSKIKIKVIGAPACVLPFPASFVEWQEATEVAELSEFDIGLMPLNDSPWNRGKCGLKALLYMSLGIPALLSPVGVSAELITHGEDGFLLDTEEAWFQTLCQLIEDAALRKRIGDKARERVVAHYSLESRKDAFAELFEG